MYLSVKLNAQVTIKHINTASSGDTKDELPTTKNVTGDPDPKHRHHIVQDGNWDSVSLGPVLSM